MSLIEQLASQGAIPIPALLENSFVPAKCCLYEWKDYWLELPEASRLLVGRTPIDPVGKTHVFRLRFENQLGIARICPLDQYGRLTEPPLVVEVISIKTAPSGSESDLRAHVSFIDNLLNDLFVRAARLPFTISAPTGRGTVEALRPPTPLFTYHFLCQHKETIQQALNIILSDPYRLLSEHPERVPVFQAQEAGTDVMLEIVHNSSEWVPVNSTTLSTLPLVIVLRGNLPQRVWQRLPEETFDSPENRFVLSFLQQLLTAADSLPAQRWWGNAPRDRKSAVTELSSLLLQIINHPLFAEVGPLTRLPFSSQVLLRRDGYRDLLTLWGQFQRARRPLFERLQQAIELRDVAALYEMWVFFALVDEIAYVVLKNEESPVLELKISDEKGLNALSKAIFSNQGELIYNQTFAYHTTPFTSYSLPLRPDFVWVQDQKPVAVFDAKFRLEWQGVESLENEEDLLSDEIRDSNHTHKWKYRQAIEQRGDLYKMHTYRDALGVKSALAVYPGERSSAYPRPEHEDRVVRQVDAITLIEILHGDFNGIGSLAMKPEPGRS